MKDSFSMAFLDVIDGIDSFPDMLDQIDTESGRRDQHRRFAGRRVNDFIAVDIPEAVLKQQLIRAVKIINVHADTYHIARKIGIRTRNIQIKAFLVLHSDAFYI